MFNTLALVTIPVSFVGFSVALLMPEFQRAIATIVAALN